MKIRNYLIVLILFNVFIAAASPLAFNRLMDQQNEPGYLSDLERQVVEELNLARTQPTEYAGFLIEYARLFTGKELREPGKMILLTNEGESAVREAIRFLKNQQPLNGLIASKGMSKAAADMVRMQETSNETGHKGRDGSTFAERISRYGTWGGSCGENIDYGNNSARRIVMALIIDDGVSNRGHRKSIFTPKFSRVGVSCGTHKTYRYMCVIEYAENYTEKIDH